MSAHFHSYDELVQLGESIRDKAIQRDSEMAGQRQLGHQDAAVTEHVSRNYADLPQLFGCFSTPNPAGAKDSVLDLQAIDSALRVPHVSLTTHGGKLQRQASRDLRAGETSLPERVKDINDLVRNWSGTAAQSFRRHCLNPITSTASLQGDLANALACALEAHLELRRQMNADVWQVGTHALALLTAGQHSSVICNHPDAKVTLKVATTVKSVIDSFEKVSTEALGKNPLNVIDFISVLSSATGVFDKKPLSKLVGGQTSLAIVRSMRDALDTVTNEVKNQEHGLKNGLVKIADQVQDPSENDLEVQAPADVVGLRGERYSDLHSATGFYPENS